MLTPERVAQIKAAPHGPMLDEWIEALEALWAENARLKATIDAVEFSAKDSGGDSFCAECMCYPPYHLHICETWRVISRLRAGLVVEGK